MINVGKFVTNFGVRHHLASAYLLLQPEDGIEYYFETSVDFQLTTERYMPEAQL
jgi:hypothetical protein